jgi:glc operon protein GlcG
MPLVVDKGGRAVRMRVWPIFLDPESNNAECCCLQPVLGVAVLLGPRVQAQLLQKKAPTLGAARKIVAAAEAEAERNHWRGVVVDDGGWVILLERMDHAAMTPCVELAEGKARSAVLFKKPTQALEEVINQGRYAAITARGFIEMQGGLPIVVDGEVIGGIGASFATPEEDEQVANAGFAALSK